MPARFKPHGPYELPVIRLKNGRRINKERLARFWEDAKVENERGIYVFVLGSAHGAEWPYYVGRTIRGFGAECFQPHKIEKLNDVLADHHGTPKLYFLVLETKLNRKAIKALEITMIGLGVERNPLMRNVMHASKDEIDVTDVMGRRKGKGARLKSAARFRKAIGLK